MTHSTFYPYFTRRWRRTLILWFSWYFLSASNDIEHIRGVQGTPISSLSAHHLNTLRVHYSTLIPIVVEFNHPRHQRRRATRRGPEIMRTQCPQLESTYEADREHLQRTQLSTRVIYMRYVLKPREAV